MFNFTLPLTKDLILKKVSEEEIFDKYLGIKPDFTHQFCNPLREDKQPGCGFYINSQDRIKFVDQGGGFNWDCFNVVEYLYSCSFREAMKIIARDFGIIDGVVSNPVKARIERKKEHLQIRVKRREWTKEDKEFWFDRYYQTRKDLEFHGISPVSHAWYLRSNGELELFYIYKTGDPCYAYYFGAYDYKLYFPKRDKKGKFRQNRGDIIQGLQQLPEKGHILINTKSLKDVVCINKVGKPHGIHAIASMSESQLIPKPIWDNVTSRFDYTFNLFDFDRAGIKLMRKYEKEYGTPWLMFGKKFKEIGVKDFADCLYIRRMEDVKELIKIVYEQRIG